MSAIAACLELIFLILAENDCSKVLCGELIGMCLNTLCHITLKDFSCYL